MQHRNSQADSRHDLETIIEEEIDNESDSEMVPVYVSKPLESALNPDATAFQPPHEDLLIAVEKPNAGCDSMEKPMETDTQQVNSDSSMPVTDRTHDTLDSAGHHSGLPNLEPVGRPPEVTHSESEVLPDTGDAQPVQDPPYLTRSGRANKPP